MSAAPQPTVYTGPSGALKKDTMWLASEDIGLDREVRVQVEAVELYRNVVFDQGRKEPKVGALKFVGKDKRLVLNSTNRKTMVRAFGMDTRGWHLAWIALYVDPEVKFAGEKVCGIRIRILTTEELKTVPKS
jgi:hypothetical protein